MGRCSSRRFGERPFVAAGCRDDGDVTLFQFHFMPPGEISDAAIYADGAERAYRRAPNALLRLRAPPLPMRLRRAH